MEHGAVRKDGAVKKIAILGASGRTGRLIVEQAQERGLGLRPVVRRPEAALDERWAVADGRDASALGTALAGCDAVAFAIGPSGRDSDPHVVSESLAAALGAMRANGIRRIALVSADGPFRDSGDPLTRFVAKPIFGRIFREGWADFTIAEDVLHRSDADWTIVRPARLTDSPRRSYRSRRGASLWFGIQTSRAATAAAILDALQHPDTVGATIAVAN